MAILFTIRLDAALILGHAIHFSFYHCPISAHSRITNLNHTSLIYISLVVNLDNMANYTKRFKYLRRLGIIMISAEPPLVNYDMEVQVAGKKRETLIDPMYKRIDKMGRVYVNRNLAEREVLIIVIEPIPEDKIHYIKVGRD